MTGTDELVHRLRAHATGEVATTAPVRPEEAQWHAAGGRRRLPARPLLAVGAVAAVALAATLVVADRDRPTTTTAATAGQEETPMLGLTPGTVVARSSGAPLTFVLTNTLGADATFPGSLVVSRLTGGEPEVVGYVVLTGSRQGLHLASPPFGLVQPGFHLGPGATHTATVDVARLPAGGYRFAGEAVDDRGVATAVEAVAEVTTG